MESLREDLVSRLQRVLYRHQVELESAAATHSHSGQCGSYPSPDHSSYSTGVDETLAYISRMLLDDDSDEENGQAGDHALEGLMEELSALVSRSNCKVDVRSIPQRNFEAPESFNFETSQGGSRVDLYRTLMECARAAAAKNFSVFFTTASRLKSQLPVPLRTPLEKAVALFLDALVARCRGTGAQTYRAMSAGISTRRLISVHLLNLPGAFVTHAFANEMILRSCSGARRVHIVDYGIFYGFQWPPVIKALAARPEGPPHLKITGIEFSYVTEASQTGKRLVEYAESVGVHLDYCSIISDTWECAQPDIHPDDVLFVNSNMRLKHTRADYLGVSNPRTQLFERIYRMKPAVFVQSVLSAGLSTPFLLPRIEEAFKYYHAKLEYRAVWVGEDAELMAFMEKLSAKDVMNIVACEGPAVVERPDTYKSWDSRAKRAGFQPVPLEQELYEKVRSLWGGYKRTSEEFRCGRDGNWMLLGWKDLVTTGMSAWKVL